jgi:hypothetical protein
LKKRRAKLVGKLISLEMTKERRWRAGREALDAEGTLQDG